MNKVHLLAAAMLVAACSAQAGGVERGVAEALDIVQKSGLKVDDAKVHQSVVRAVARAADPFAEVYSPAVAQQRQDEAAGSVAAAGFRLGITNGLPVVIDVDSGSPAARVGVLKGDIIIGIVGEDEFEALTLPSAMRATRGEADAKLELLLRRGTSSTGVVVTLAKQKLPAIEIADRLPNAILYLKLNGLFAGSGAEVAAELRGWAAKNKGGAVLDLRDAGGDDLASAAKIAGLFAKEGDSLFIHEAGGDQGRSAHVAEAGAKPLGAPLMVLVDSRTRGAAEVLAAALADSVKGAMLVGETTAADPLVREFIKLDSGDVLYLATRKIRTAARVYDGREGVKPDVVMNEGATRAEYDAEPAADHRRALLDQELQDFALRNRIKGDPVLRRAVDILLGLKALNIGAGGLRSGGG